MSRTFPPAIAGLLLLASLGGLMVPAGGDVPVDLIFSGFRDYGADENDNTLYDALVIEFFVEATVAGTYSVVGDLNVQVSETPILIKSISKDVGLEVGQNTVQLSFPSEVIYRKGISGFYIIYIDMQKTDWFVPFNTIQDTQFYDYTDFEAEENPPPVPPDAPKVDVGSQYINVSTEVFLVYVNRTSPEVIYRYKEDRPGLPYFIIRFSRLLFFFDDGDGVYDGETPAGSCVLENYPWAFQNFQVMGSRVTFDLKGLVPISTGSGFPKVNVVFSYLITNGSGQDPHGPSFIQGRAAELKVDVSLEMMEPIPDADSLALETIVSDTLGSHGFLFEDPTGFHLFDRTNETAYAKTPQLPMKDSTIVGLVDDNVVEHAFYGWKRVVSEWWDGSEEAVDVEVTSSFRVTAGHLEVLMTYPYSEDVDRVLHDPSVGILVENLPPEPMPEPPDEKAAPNIYVWMFAIVVAVVILILSVYARAQGF